MKRRSLRPTLHSHPHVQNYVLKQIGEMRGPATDLVALIDEILSSGALSPTHHLAWRACLGLLSEVEADLWRVQIGTNNHRTAHWPDTSWLKLTYRTFTNRDPIFKFVTAESRREWEEEK